MPWARPGLLAALLVCGLSGFPAAKAGEDEAGLAESPHVDAAARAPIRSLEALDAWSDAWSAAEADADTSSSAQGRGLAAQASVVSALDLAGGLVAAGRRTSFMIRPSSPGVIWASGQNNWGQLGLGDTEDRWTPTPVPLPNGTAMVVAVVAAAFHTMFLTEAGEVYAAGRNRFGQFGLGSFASFTSPTQVHTGVADVSCGYGHCLFLMVDRSVQAAGLNSAGQLGDNTTEKRIGRITVFESNVFTTLALQVAAGYDFSYILVFSATSLRNEVLAFGQNLGGQLGDGTRVTQLLPVKMVTQGGWPLPHVLHIYAGDSHGVMFYLEEPTGLWAVLGVGANSHGQLGYPASEGQFYPEAAYLWSFTVRGKAIYIGGDNTCIYQQSTRYRGLKCTGSNLDGQLGDTDSIVTYPETLGGVDELWAKSIGLGGSHSLVMQADYSDVSTSGTNLAGELCYATPNETSSNVFAGVGFAWSTSTTSTTSRTYTTITTTSTTYTATTLIGMPNRSRDGLTDDPDTIQMLQILVGMGAAAALVGFVVRRRVGDDDEGHDMTLRPPHSVRAAEGGDIEMEYGAEGLRGGMVDVDLGTRSAVV